MGDLFEITNFVTKDNFQQIGLSLIVGAGIVMIIVQAWKGTVDSLFKSLAKIPVVKKVIKKPMKTATLTHIICVCYSAFILSNVLCYAVDPIYIGLLVFNSSALSCITKGGFNKFLKGITIGRVPVEQESK